MHKIKLMKKIFLGLSICGIGLLSITPILVTNLNKKINEDSSILENNNFYLNTEVSIIQNKINALDPQFADFYENQYPSYFEDINSNLNKVSIILNNFIEYKDVKTNFNPIIKTSLTKKEFWAKSQLGDNNLPIDKTIHFEYVPLEFNKIAAGIAQINLVDGTNTIGSITINNLKSQFDIYYRQYPNNGTNPNDSASYNAPCFDLKGIYDSELNKLTYSTDNSNSNYISNKTLIDIGVDKINADWIINNLIQFNNQNNNLLFNENLIQKDSNPNAILATNLSKDDFLKMTGIKISVVPYVGMGKLKVTISLNSEYDNQNSWINSKPAYIDDLRGNDYILKQLPISSNNNIVFWLGGFKKDYSFNQNIQNKIYQLDATKMKENNDQNSLLFSNYVPYYIQQDVINNTTNDILKYLIAFNAYEVNEQDPNNYLLDKLLKTNLTYNDVISLSHFKFANDQLNNINIIDDFNGIYKGRLLFDKDIINKYYFDGAISSKWSEVSKNTDYIDFEVNNLTKNIWFLCNDKDINNNILDIDVSDFLSGYTINNFFGDKAINNEIIQDTILNSNLIKYNAVKSDGKISNTDFQNFLFLTNAKDKESFKKMFNVLNDGNILVDYQNGTIQFNIQYKNYLNEKGFINGESNLDKIFTIKLFGFKKSTISSYSFIENQKYNGGIIDIKELDKNINSINEVNEEFILNHIYFNDNNNLNDNYIYKTNADKETFINNIIFNNNYKYAINIINGENNNTLNISIQLIRSSITPNNWSDWNQLINQYPTLKEDFLNNQNSNNISMELIDKYNLSPTVTYHFKIIGFDNLTPQYQINSNFNINGFNLDDLSQSYIINNLMYFNDQHVENWIVKFDCNKQFYLDKIYNSIEINKDYINKSANVIFLNNNLDTDQFIINIFNFNAEAIFKVNNNLVLTDSKYNIESVNQDFILDNFINYDNEITTSNSIINTNISKYEFINNYVNKIAILKKDYLTNMISVQFYLKRPINEQSNLIFNIYFDLNLINIYNINNNFKINNDFDLNDPSQEILNFISFNDSINNPDDILFSVNLDYDSFINNFDISYNINQNNGTINFTFSLKNNSDKNLVVQSFNQKQNKFSILVFGLNAKASVNLNSSIDTSKYSEFDSISEINQITFDDIYSWIQYKSVNKQKSKLNNQCILGSTEMTQEEFKQITELKIYQDNNNINIEFDFKSPVNFNQNKIIVSLENLSFLNKKTANNMNIIIIATLSSVSGLIVISLIVGLITYYSYKKKQEKIKKAKMQNTLE